MTATHLFAALVALGCSKKSGDAQESGDSKPASYTARGQVMGIEGGEIRIHHEEIPDFVSRDGKVVGMVSMSMPFAVKGASLEGISKGDKVRFTFEVDWEARPTTSVTAIEKLPADTAIELSGM